MAGGLFGMLRAYGKSDEGRRGGGFFHRTLWGTRGRRRRTPKLIFLFFAAAAFFHQGPIRGPFHTSLIPVGGAKISVVGRGWLLGGRTAPSTRCGRSGGIGGGRFGFV